MVSSSGVGFSSAWAREQTYGKANEYCAKRGLVMVPVSFDAREGVYAQSAPSANLVFRALRPGDPEIKRPNVEGPNHIAKRQQILLQEQQMAGQQQQARSEAAVGALQDMRQSYQRNADIYQQQAQASMNQMTDQMLPMPGSPIPMAGRPTRTVSGVITPSLSGRSATFDGTIR